MCQTTDTPDSPLAADAGRLRGALLGVTSSGRSRHCKARTPWGEPSNVATPLQARKRAVGELEDSSAKASELCGSVVSYDYELGSINCLLSSIISEEMLEAIIYALDDRIQDFLRDDR